MTRDKRNALIGGIILIGLGLCFLAGQLSPQLRILSNFTFAWPLIIVAVGVFLLVLGILLGEPGMAVPAVIVSGIGGILYWQNATGNWSSWAYAWTLIPGFVGLGIILAGLLGGEFRQSLQGGLTLIVISTLLLFVFGSIFGAWSWLGPYWPVLIILLGLILLIRAIFRPRHA